MNAVATPEWKAIEWSRNAATTVAVDDPSLRIGKRVIAECGTVEDARLISAAREMLEALKGVVRVADRKTDEFDAARAAIAKATGAQS